MLTPEVIGAGVAGALTVALSALAVWKGRQTPHLRQVSDGASAEDALRQILIRELREEVRALKRELAQSERRVMFLLERLLRDSLGSEES